VVAAAGGVADLDPVKSAVKGATIGAFGAGGELAGAAGSALWRRYVTVPGLVDNAGKLTPKGAQEARAAGLDPEQLSAELSKQFAQALSKTGSADTAARGVTSSEFGIRRTRGELQNDIPTLIREQQVRGGNYGGDPAARMKAFDEGQVDDINNALFGTITKPTTGRQVPGLAQRIAPDRSAADYGKAELGQSIRSNTQQALDAAKAKDEFAWSFVPNDITPKPDALPLLKERLNQSLGSFPVPKGTNAAQMADDLSRFLKGEAPENAADWITANPVGNINQFRERLSGLVMTAEPGRDKAAALKLYEGYNNWIKDAAEKGLLEGASPFEAAKMVIARGISRDIHQVFEGQQGTPGARILADVLKKVDSPEGIINSLFTGPTSEIKGGTTTALQNLKQAYGKHLPAEAAESAWNDIRLAYFMRMTQDMSKSSGYNGGAITAGGAQALQSNIAKALSKQSSVMRLLYTPEEIGQFQRFSAALQGIEKKNINRSWSGVSAASFAKDFFGAMIQSLGFNSKLAGTVGNMAGANIVKRAYGNAAASEAISGGVKSLPAPSFAGPGAALGARSNE
jgi:hypothetical protein